MAAGMPAPGDPFADLDLTATQREKLKELHRRDRARMQEAENALEDAREDLREVLDTPGRGKAFEDKAKAAHAKVVKLQAELEEQRFENVLAIRSVLNDEQLKKFSHHRPPRPFRPSEGAPDASKDTRSPGNSGEGGPSAPDAHPGTGD
jgi:Spy/CpxP family protein refolding chaperone